MKFDFVAKHQGIWSVRWLCAAPGVSRSGFHGWLTRNPSLHTRTDELLATKVRSSFLGSDRTYGARRVWHDVLVDGSDCGLPKDNGVRSASAVVQNVLDRQFTAQALNQKWVADFTYICTA